MKLWPGVWCLVFDSRCIHALHLIYSLKRCNTKLQLSLIIWVVCNNKCDKNKFGVLFLKCSDVVLEALPCLEPVFACLGLSSASVARCLGLASVSNQVPRPQLGSIIFGSASARSQSFCLGLASASTAMARVGWT